MENSLSQNAPQTQQPQKAKFPVGMTLILVLIGIGFVSSLASLRNPMTIIGPFFIEGIVAVLYILATTTILGLIFFGILKRKSWARPLLLIWQTYSILSITAMFLSFLANKEGFVEFYRNYMPSSAEFFTESTVMISLLPGLVFSWIIGLVVIIYVYRKKSFFTN
jgi:hypothetical protein